MSGVAGCLVFGPRSWGERRLEALAAMPHRGGYGVARVRRGPFAGVVLASRPDERPWVSADGRLAVVADCRLLERGALVRQLARELMAELGPEPGMEVELGRDPEPALARGAGEDPAAGYPVPDAALLAAGWRRWGEELPDHLDGDFAFALWDGEERRLLLARDAAGARPLAWGRSRDGLAFASEPAPLMAALELPALELPNADALDEEAVVDFLCLDFRPRGRTLHAGVHRLAPGHRLVLRPGGEARPERWWHPERAAHPGARTPGEWAEAFRERLERAAVGRRDRAGGAGGAPAVIPAVMLSGGLDSSAVAAVLAKGSAPHLLTHVFPTFRRCDESPFAAAVADHLGRPLHRISAERDLVPVSAEDLGPGKGAGDGRPRVPPEPWVAAQERMAGPFLDLAAGLGSAALFTGLGGDALFDAARWRYRDDVRRGRWWRLGPWIADRHRRGSSWLRAATAVVAGPLLPAPVMEILGRLAAGADRGPRRRAVPPWIPGDLARRTAAARRLAQPAAEGRFRGARQAQYEHLVGLAQQAVTVDALEACAARRGLEVFHPLLDRRVAELALAAPLELGAVPGPAGSKHLLRRALGERLPRPVREREDKAGWGPWLAHLLRGPAGATAADLLRDGVAARSGLVDGAVLERELTRFRTGSSSWGHGLWFLPPLLLELWLRAAAAPGADRSGQARLGEEVAA